MRSEKSIPYLLREVNSRFTDIKYNTLLALAKIGDTEAFIEAFKQLDNSILLSERSLIEIVDSFEGDKKYIYKKMIHMKNDTIAVVFIKSAGNFKDMSLNEEIAIFLKDKNKEKKISAVKALGNMADNRFIEDMITLLEDEEWEVRAVVAKALGVFEEHRILPSLIKALSDAQWFVRYNAAYSILSIDKSMESLICIFESDDKFAKDIILSVLENTGLINNMESYGSSDDALKKKISFLVGNYINKNEDD
jgi:HEAT repeat protein